MSNQTYNGWTNYPTWNVKLWIDNDMGMHEFVHEHVAQEIEDHKDAEDHDATRYEVQQFLRNYIEEYVETFDIPASMASDLLGYALGQVNWGEIAIALIEDHEEF